MYSYYVYLKKIYRTVLLTVLGIFIAVLYTAILRQNHCKNTIRKVTLQKVELEKRLVMELPCMNIDSLVMNASLQFKVDPFLIKALMKQESDTIWNCVSRKGAIGLMQIMPYLIPDSLRGKNPFDPKVNIPIGVSFLKTQLIKYRDLDLALAAYNCGPAAVDKTHGVPDFKETKDFIKAVKLNYWKE